MTLIANEIHMSRCRPQKSLCWNGSCGLKTPVSDAVVSWDLFQEVTAFRLQVESTHQTNFKYLP
jgi:hypothetical protein